MDWVRKVYENASFQGVRAAIMLLVLVGICLFFHVATEGVFLSSQNVVNLFRQSSIVAILATGLVLVIVSGHIDLSVGSLAAFAGGLAALLVWHLHWPLPWVLIVTLAAGTLAGALQGWLVAYTGVPAFIVTLGGMLIFRGAISAAMGGETVPVPSDFQFLGSGFLTIAQGWMVVAIAGVLGVLWLWLRIWEQSEGKLRRRHKSWLFFESVLLVVGLVVLMDVFVRSSEVGGRPPITTPIRLPEESVLYQSEWYRHAMKQQEGIVKEVDRSIPMPVVVMFFLALFFSFLSTRTVFGRHVFAIGGNADAAFLAGIAVRKKVMITFMLCGLLGAVAGIMYAARLGSATPDAARGYELYAIAACVIGGCSLSGGKGSVVGAVTGALIIAALDSGMSILNVDPFYQDIIKGFILVLAVLVDTVSRKR